VLLDAAGKACALDAWRPKMAAADRVVGYETFTLNNSKIYVFARYAGVPHGAQKRAFECSITGDPKNAKHAALHGRHELAADRAACLTLFNKAVADIKAAGGTTPAPMVP
jgi:hypothetical protein